MGPENNDISELLSRLTESQLREVIHQAQQELRVRTQSALVPRNPGTVALFHQPEEYIFPLSDVTLLILTAIVLTSAVTRLPTYDPRYAIASSNRTVISLLAASIFIHLGAGPSIGVIQPNTTLAPHTGGIFGTLIPLHTLNQGHTIFNPQQRALSPLLDSMQLWRRQAAMNAGLMGGGWLFAERRPSAWGSNSLVSSTATHHKLSSRQHLACSRSC